VNVTVFDINDNNREIDGTSKISASILASTRGVGLVWIPFISYLSTDSPVGEKLDFVVPFVFKSRQASHSENSLNSMQASVNSTRKFRLMSIWPSRGPVKGSTVVTLRVNASQPVVSYADFTWDRFRVISSCPENERQCLKFSSSTCEVYEQCIQQIPLINIIITFDNIILIQYSTIPFSRTEKASQYLSFQGEVDVQKTASWFFQYTDYEPLTVQRVVPSQGPIEGSTLVRIWIVNLTKTANGSSLPMVQFGKYNASVKGVDYWGSDNSTVITLLTPAYPQQGQVSIKIWWREMLTSAIFQYDLTRAVGIRSIIPSSGTGDGGYSILINIASISRFNSALKFSSWQVSVDGQLCPVTIHSDSNPGSVSREETVLLSVEVPPHVEGAANIFVYPNLSLWDSSVQPLIGSFWFESEFSLFGVSGVLLSIFPSHTVSTGSCFASCKLRNAPSDDALDYSVSVAGINCIVSRLDAMSDSTVILFFSIPPLVPAEMVVASISVYDRSGSLHSTNTSFKNYMNSSHKVVVCAFPSSGPTLGGTSVRASIVGFFPAEDTSDITVLFGQVQVQVESLSQTGITTDLGFVSPPYLCNGSCSLLVKIFGPYIQQASFTFTYLQSNAYITKISASTIARRGGDLVTVNIANFPVVTSIHEMKIDWGGLLSNIPADIMFSDTRQTEILISTPNLSSVIYGMDDRSLPVFISSQINDEKSVVFDLIVLSQQPRLLQFRPSQGPCTGGFMIDVLVEHFPVRPDASFNENYEDISGPFVPLIMVDGGAVNISAVELAGMGAVENSTTQISFYLPGDKYCVPGSKSVGIGTSESRGPLVFFNITLYDASTPTILGFVPSSGPASAINTVVSVDIGSLWVGEGTRRNPVVIARNIECNLLNVKSSGFITHLVFELPAQRQPGTFNVQIYPYRGSDKFVQFEYLAKPNEGPDFGCIMGNFATTEMDAFTHGLKEVPLEVVMIVPRQGPVIGGSRLKISCAGPWTKLSSLDRSDIVVTMAGSLAAIVSVVVSKNSDILEVVIMTPPAAARGAIKGQIFLFQNPFQYAEFVYNYLSIQDTPNITSVSPSSGLQGSSEAVVIQVHSNL
jgi:hypothetical protein